MPLGAGVPGAAGSFYYPSTAPSGFTYRSFAETGIFWTPGMGDNRAPDTAVTINTAVPWSMVTNPFGYVPPGGSVPAEYSPPPEPAYVPPAPVFNTPPPPPPAPVPYTNPIPEQVLVTGTPIAQPQFAPVSFAPPALDLSVAAPLPNNTGGAIAIDTPPPPPPATAPLTALALAAMPDGTTFIAPNGHSITKYVFKNIGIVGAGEPEIGWSDNTTGEWIFDPAQFGVFGYTVQWQSVPEQVVVTGFTPVATPAPALDLSVAAPVPDFTGGSPDTQPVPYTDNTVEQVLVTANKLPPAPVADTSPALDLSVAAPVPDLTGGASDNTPYTDNTPEQVTVTAQRPDPPQVLPVAVAIPPVAIDATQVLDSFPSDFTPGDGSPKVKWPKQPGKEHPFNPGSTPKTGAPRSQNRNAPQEDLHPWKALHDFWNTAPNRTAKNHTVAPRTHTTRPPEDLHPWQTLRDFFKQSGAVNSHGSGVDLTTHGAVVQSNAQPAQSMNWLLILLAAVGVFIAERN